MSIKGRAKGDRGWGKYREARRMKWKVIKYIESIVNVVLLRIMSKIPKWKVIKL